MILTGDNAKFAEELIESAEKHGCHRQELTEEEQRNLFSISETFQRDALFRLTQHFLLQVYAIYGTLGKQREFSRLFADFLENAANEIEENLLEEIFGGLDND